MATLNCRKCGYSFESPRQDAGAVVSCPQCQAVVAVRPSLPDARPEGPDTQIEASDQRFYRLLQLMLEYERRAPAVGARAG